MKFCYFLQTLRGVPLEYNFTLYSYGPFDSEVLSDLNSAEAMGAVESQLVFHFGGYGYEIKEGKVGRASRELSSGFLSKYEDSIEWVLKEFGQLGAAHLELLSTIVYVDREAVRRHESLALSELVQRVHER